MRTEGDKFGENIQRLTGRSDNPIKTSFHLVYCWYLNCFRYRTFICMCVCVVGGVSVAWHNIYVENCVITSPVTTEILLSKIIIILQLCFTLSLNSYHFTSFKLHLFASRSAKWMQEEFSDCTWFFQLLTNFICLIRVSVFPEMINVMFIFTSRNNFKKNIH